MNILSRKEHLAEKIVFKRLNRKEKNSASSS